MYKESTKVGRFNSFSHLHSISDWVETGTKTPHLTAAIPLLFRDSPEIIAERVSENGNSAIILVTWPDLPVDLKHLYRNSR